MQEVTTKITPSISFMLDAIRQNHIDIIPIIQEELNEFLPEYIETIIKNIYTHLEVK